jgi:hypothetical protein
MFGILMAIPMGECILFVLSNRVDKQTIEEV